MRTFLILLLLPATSITVLHSQSALTEHTLRLDPGTPSPPAAIDDLAWLTGRWTGEGFGGLFEESWAPPMGGAMPATFRLLHEGKPVFYEICLIAEEGGTLVYKVKHFHPDLRGWEERDEYVSFPLVRLDPGAAWFDGLTMRRTGRNTAVVYLALKEDDGPVREEVLYYRREKRKK